MRVISATACHQAATAGLWRDWVKLNCGDPLKPDPVAYVDDGCVACGHCGEVADTAVLCPSFYRTEWVRNPSAWEQRLDRWRRKVVGWFQARQGRALRQRALYAQAES